MLNLFQHLLFFDKGKPPDNSPHLFPVLCGIAGLSKLLSEGKMEVFSILQHYASDERWRTREIVAMALKRLGEKNMDTLLQEMEQWKVQFRMK